MRESSENKKVFAVEKYNDSIIYNIGKLYVFLNQYFRGAYKKFALNPAKFNLLMLIKHLGKEKGISQAKLRDKLFVSAANITKLIDGLEKRGWVRRYSSGKDRRINLVKITQEGSELLDRAWIKHVQALNNLLRKFSESDKEKFNEFLERFKREMEEKKNE